MCKSWGMDKASAAEAFVSAVESLSELLRL